MISFNGKLLSEYGVSVDESNAHIKAKRSYTTTSVAGRNGDLTFSNNRYENVSIAIPCFIRSDYIDRYASLMAYLTAEDGYKRLEMSSEPDYYREAILDSSDDPTTGPWTKSASFTLTFNCKPQRWYKSGEIAIVSPTSLYNPSLMTALPLIRIYGGGVLAVGDETLTIADNDYEYIDIDCYLQDAYSGAANCNSLISLSSGDFPHLVPGKTGISFTGKSYEVIPRWWTI